MSVILIASLDDDQSLEVFTNEPSLRSSLINSSIEGIFGAENLAEIISKTKEGKSSKLQLTFQQQNFSVETFPRTNGFLANFQVLDLELDVESIKEKEKAMERFAYIVSHDLQAPMRSLDSLVNWLREDGEQLLDETCLMHLKMIDSQVVKLNELFRGVLLFSRIGRMHTEVHEVNPMQLIEELVSSLEIQDSIKVSGNMPRLIMNKRRAKELFQYLLDNAKKYGNQGIELELQEKSFNLTSRGMGVPAKDKERLFDIFQTLGGAKDGDGVGLALAKKIVDFYKGSISLETDESTFVTIQVNLDKVA